MAYIVDQYCITCQRDTEHFNGECAECRAREQAVRDDQDLQRFRALLPNVKIEELYFRLRRLEKDVEPLK